MHKRPVLLALVEPVLVAALLALFVRTFLFQAFTIPSGSMERNLQIGDRILVNKFIYHPQPAAAGVGWLGALLPVRPLARGDVVVFRYPLEPERDFIKRCVGLPGDTIEIERRRLSINGQEIDESGYTFFSDDRIYPRSVVLPSVLRTRDNYGPYTVPEGQQRRRPRRAWTTPHRASRHRQRATSRCRCRPRATPTGGACCAGCAELCLQPVTGC